MASAAQTLRMSVEQYLSTPFRPDVDYVDGYIEQRNGEYFAMGVPAVWIVESQPRSLTVCLADGAKASHRRGSIFLGGTAVAANLDELFSVLDESQRLRRYETRAPN